MPKPTTPDPVTLEPGNDPTGQPDPAAQVRDAEAVMAKNKELLGEIKTLQKKIAGFESASDKDKEAKLKEEGKLQELLAKKEQELKDSKDAIKRAKVETAMERAGIIDPDYADVLMRAIQFDDAENPSNLDEVIKDWKERKPWAFKQPDTPPPPGTNNAGANWKTGHVFTKSEVEAMDAKTLDANWPEIQRQDVAGLIK